MSRRRISRRLGAGIGLGAPAEESHALDPHSAGPSLGVRPRSRGDAEWQASSVGDWIVIHATSGLRPTGRGCSAPSRPPRNTGTAPVPEPQAGGCSACPANGRHSLLAIRDRGHPYPSPQACGDTEGRVRKGSSDGARTVFRGDRRRASTGMVGRCTGLRTDSCGDGRRRGRGASGIPRGHHPAAALSAGASLDSSFARSRREAGEGRSTSGDDRHHTGR